MQDGSEQVEATGIRERNPVDFANLRVLQQNFIQLSVAADHKANIVIAATLVMLSLLVSNMHSGRMPMVGYVMGGFLLLACLFALLGVVPRITLHRDGKDGQARMANPFFFGDLDKISAEDYLSALAEVLAEDADLFKTMALDVYYQGCVLRRKYQYLRYSYQTLFIGLVVASLVLVTEYFLK